MDLHNNLFLFIASVVLNRHIILDQSAASFLRHFFFVAAIFVYCLYALPRFNIGLLVIGLLLAAISMIRWRYLGASEVVVLQFYQSILFAYLIAAGLSQFKAVSYLIFLLAHLLFYCS